MRLTKILSLESAPRVSPPMLMTGSADGPVRAKTHGKPRTYRTPLQAAITTSWILLCAALCWNAAPLFAQQNNEVEQLKRQLQQMKEDFERVQREHREQMDALTRKLDDLLK